MAPQRAVLCQDEHRPSWKNSRTYKVPPSSCVSSRSPHQLVRHIHHNTAQLSYEHVNLAIPATARWSNTMGFRWCRNGRYPCGLMDWYGLMTMPNLWENKPCWLRTDHSPWHISSIIYKYFLPIAMAQLRISWNTKQHVNMKKTMQTVTGEQCSTCEVVPDYTDWLRIRRDFPVHGLWQSPTGWWF